MVFGELYRNGAEWKFRAVGQGYASGLCGHRRGLRRQRLTRRTLIDEPSSSNPYRRHLNAAARRRPDGAQEGAPGPVPGRPSAVVGARRQPSSSSRRRVFRIFPPGLRGRPLAPGTRRGTGTLNAAMRSREEPAQLLLATDAPGRGTHHRADLLAQHLVRHADDRARPPPPGCSYRAASTSAQ